MLLVENLNASCGQTVYICFPPPVRTLNVSSDKIKPAKPAGVSHRGKERQHFILQRYSHVEPGLSNYNRGVKQLLSALHFKASVSVREELQMVLTGKKMSWRRPPACI